VDKEYLRKYEEKNNYRVVYNKKNLMFTRAVNQGIKIADGGYILLLNPDVLWNKNLKSEPIIKMLTVIESDKRVGIVGIVEKEFNSEEITFCGGCIINRITGRHTGAGEVFVKWREEVYSYDMLENKDKHEGNGRSLWAHGAIFMIKRELINQIGFLPYNKTCVHCFSEIIYCQIATYNRWKVMIVKDSYAYHGCI